MGVKEGGPLSTVLSSGQTHVPTEVRKALDLKEGDMLMWHVLTPTKAEIQRVAIKVVTQ